MGHRSITFGINVNTRCSVIYPDVYPPTKLLEMAERVEALGYDTVVVGDNYFSKPRLEATTTLAAIAARTARVKLATSALISPLRNTVWLALQWATADLFSGGRTVLVVCVGGGSAEAGGPGFTREFDVAGVPYKRRGALMEEQIRVLRALWSDGPTTFHGEFHELEGITADPRPVQRPAPPIWIANNPQIFPLDSNIVVRMLRRVATMADGWQTCLATPQEYVAMLEQIRSYAAEAGRDPGSITPSYQVTLNVSDDRETARREALDFINRYYGTAYGSVEESMWERDPFGSPEEVTEKVGGILDAGCRDISVRFASHDQFGQLERFTEQVLPALRERAGTPQVLVER